MRVQHIRHQSHSDLTQSVANPIRHPSESWGIPVADTRLERGYPSFRWGDELWGGGGDGPNTQ
jgi:hypothetical protein